MTYPKPLSGKSLERLYRQSGMTEKQMEFLRRFVLACVNLYGAFLAEEAWQVYRQFKVVANPIKILRKQLFEMLAIMRREPDNPFYVFEIDEVYRDDKRKPEDMIVANKKLIGSGYGKFDSLYTLLDNSFEKPFYVPENLLEYVEMPENIYETKLLHELEELKSTEKMVPNDFTGERTKKCKYTGKRLKDFSYVSGRDRVQLDIAKGKYSTKANPEEVVRIKARINSVNAAQRLVNELGWGIGVGSDSPMQVFGNMIDDLVDMGVDIFHAKNVDKILRLMEDMNNHQHLWCNHGWTPIDLRNYYGPIVNPTISIGPGLKRDFEEGVIDKEAYLKVMHDLGFKVLGEDL